MDPTDAIPLSARVLDTGVSAGLAGWRARWRQFVRRHQADRRHRSVELHTARLWGLAGVLGIATLCVSVATVWWQSQNLAQRHANAALTHVETRLHEVVHEMSALAAGTDAWSFDACPESLRQSLTRASIRSLQVRRFAVVVVGEATACFPDGPLAIPALPLMADGLPHVVRAEADDLWVTLSSRDRLPGAFVLAQLDPRIFGGWSARSTPGALESAVPARAWTVRLSGSDGLALARFGGELRPRTVAKGAEHALWSRHFQIGVEATTTTTEINAAAWRRSAAVAVPVFAGASLLVFLFWRSTVHRARLAHRIQRGLRKRQFEPHVQPIIDLATGRCAGVEVLMRWHHPHRGVLAPAEFIEEAERTGQIVAMSDLVMARAAHRMAAIAQARPDLYYSFNVTPSQLRQPDFQRRLSELFRPDTLARERILLELTERELVDADTGRILAQLRAQGWRLAVDDFGTGHSSLAALEQITIDRIKIDRAFVRTIDEATVSRPVLDAIIALAGELGVPLIAEGVETQSQWDYLAARGVGHAQGFLMARPMPIEDFGAWLASRGEVTSASASATAEDASGVNLGGDQVAQLLWRQMREAGGLVVRDRSFHLQAYRQCFIGREAVDWIVDRMGVRRTEAVRIGQRLAALDLIRHVNDEHDFEDAELYFRFVEPQAEPQVPMPPDEQYRQALCGPDGVAMIDHARGPIRLRHCATGRGIVDWTVQRHRVSRATACHWATQLMRTGALRHVFDDRPFSDDRRLFRLH